MIGPKWKSGIAATVANKKVRVRGYAERIEGTTRFRFYCPEGHVHTQDMSKPKRKGLLAMNEQAIEKFSRYWSKQSGGVSFDCPQCTREYRAELTARRNRTIQCLGR